MSREIKFRAWVKKEDWQDDNDDYPFMAYDIQNIYDGMGDKSGKLGGISVFSGFLNDERFEVMQFTGLKDKNGKEIYEGDVVTYFMGKKAVIKFGDYMVDGPDYYSNFTQAGFYAEYLDKETSGLKNSDEIEVIGNIYENPELLNK